MSGEELNRKYLEMCGWDLIEPQFLQNDTQRKTGIGRPRGTGTTQALPPIHLDANLAIAEADKVFGQWSADRTQRDVATFAAWSSDLLAEGRGATFCEAILKALIAAKELSLTPAKRKAEK